MAVAHVCLIPGPSPPVPDGWCETRQLPLVWAGPVRRLTPSDVDLHGHVTGCADCEVWTSSPVDLSDPSGARGR
ncbi:MAG: hypothetical protein ACRYG2_23555 [Janthinobacterium lividum]